MVRTAGVKTTNDSRGNLKTITINTKKHPQAVELLKEAGLIEKDPLQREIMENPEKFTTVKEGFKRVKQEVRTSWEKWKAQQ